MTEVSESSDGKKSTLKGDLVNKNTPQVEGSKSPQFGKFTPEGHAGIENIVPGTTLRHRDGRIFEIVSVTDGRGGKIVRIESQTDGVGTNKQLLELLNEINGPDKKYSFTE